MMDGWMDGWMDAWIERERERGKEGRGGRGSDRTHAGS